ncbi:unnamed protein product [Cylicocyclus nassatus]|uniref:Intraflagellar transport protein 74 homolog n=1 Tax=Cylicocyclus nassatus TaxID=53992 RepID=A0AA36H0U7_CYLNA|nr:unnamed protein product [Cylicocyclus nassatus]
MSRPPSARPKTSSGRAASAARRAAPPEQMMGNGSIPVPRPPSRISISRAGAPPPAVPPSRSGIGSRMGTPQQRLGTAQRVGSAGGDRPATGMARPPTGLNPTIRPVTQQGLSGGRAVSRLGTGSMRQVHDKSYYIGLIRAKMNQLTAEIGRLEEVYQKGLRDRMELDAYEERAKQSALELKEMQGKLIDYNVIIDNMHTNRDVSDFEAEVRRAKENADEVETTVKELFNERQAREREAAEIAMEIDEQKRLNQAVLAGMDPGIRQHYDECKEKSESLRAEVDEIQDEVNRLNEQIDQYEMELGNSPLKKKAVQLQQNLMELEKKRSALLIEKEAKETPQQKKQKLIEQMRASNEDIEKMEKQLLKINEQINIAHEELREFDSSANEKLGLQNKETSVEAKIVQFVAKNNEKYHDLLVKEKEYDDFLRGFEELKENLTVELDKYGDEIVQILKRISLNVEQAAALEPKVTALDMNELLQGRATLEELRNLYIRLQEELQTLGDIEVRFDNEMEAMRTKMAEMREQIESFTDVDKIAAEAREDVEKLQGRHEELKSIVPVLEERRVRCEQRLRDLREQLNDNPEYAAYLSQRKKLDMLREENARRKAEIEEREKETNYEPLKAEVRRLRALYNERLVAKLKRK